MWYVTWSVWTWTCCPDLVHLWLGVSGLTWVACCHYRIWIDWWICYLDSGLPSLSLELDLGLDLGLVSLWCGTSFWICSWISSVDLQHHFVWNILYLFRSCLPTWTWPWTCLSCLDPPSLDCMLWLETCVPWCYYTVWLDSWTWCIAFLWLWILPDWTWLDLTWDPIWNGLGPELGLYPGLVCLDLLNL